MIIIGSLNHCPHSLFSLSAPAVGPKMPPASKRKKARVDHAYLHYACLRHGLTRTVQENLATKPRSFLPSFKDPTQRSLISTISKYYAVGHDMNLTYCCQSKEHFTILGKMDCSEFSSFLSFVGYTCFESSTVSRIPASPSPRQR